jgi:RsiW-degrading membrane proteinase PrsW (M82 family)
MPDQWIIGLGALPALLVMGYMDRLDRKRPEPPASLRRVAIAGAVAVIPCIIIELILDRLGRGLPEYTGAIYKGFIVAAAVEELAKVLCVRLFIWNRPEFDERMDGIVYAARAGLGFALVENVFYLLGQRHNFTSLAVVFLMRAVFAVPGHAIFAGVMGYFAARRRFDRTGPGLIGGYVLAVLMHGSYDAAIFSSVISGSYATSDPMTYGLLGVPVLIVLVGAVVLRVMVKRAIAADDAAVAAAASLPAYGQAA